MINKELIKHISHDNTLVEISKDILSDKRKNLHDLSNDTILLPNLKLGYLLKKQLATIAKHELILPNFINFDDFNNLTLHQTILNKHVTEIDIYDLIKDFSWAQSYDILKLSSNFLKFFEDISKNKTSLIEKNGETSSLILKQKKINTNSLIRFESKIISEIWNYFYKYKINNKKNFMFSFISSLENIISSKSGLIYILGYNNFNNLQYEFIDLHSKDKQIKIYQLKEKKKLSCATQKLLLNLNKSSPQDNFVKNIQNIKTTANLEDSSNKIKIVGYKSFECEAAAIEKQIKYWIHNGETDIAFISFDLAISRRVRALLERNNIYFENELGWVLSTTTVGSFLVTFLDNIRERFLSDNINNLLRYPYVFSKLINRDNKIKNFRIDFCKKNFSKENEIKNIFDNILKKIPNKKLRIQTWLDIFSNCLNDIQAVDGLKLDEVGIKILNLISEAKFSLESSKIKFNFEFFINWFKHILENQKYKEDITEGIKLTNLNLSRFRKYKCIILSGLNYSNFWNYEKNNYFFCDAVRQEFGLQKTEDIFREIDNDFYNLLNSSEKIYCTWKSENNGEKNTLYPFFEKLKFSLEYIWGDRISRCNLPDFNDYESNKFLQSFEMRPEVSVWDNSLIPTQLSFSRYDSLLNCPYQYFIKYILNLENKIPNNTYMNKAEFSKIVHKILLHFHQQMKIPFTKEQKNNLNKLRSISKYFFKTSILKNQMNLHWLYLWLDFLDEYFKWEIEREKKGWYFSEGEIKKNISITLKNQKKLRLTGFIDRIDLNKNKSTKVSIIDYKLQNKNEFLKKINLRKNKQILFYSLFYESMINESFYLIFDQKKIHSIPLNLDSSDTLKDEKNLIKNIFENIYENKKFRAQGLERTCSLCDIKDICRKKKWELNEKSR